MRTIGQAIRFGLVGVVNTAVDFGLFVALVTLLHMSPPIGNVISYSAGVLCSFVLNGAWTFRHNPRAGRSRRFGAFLAVNLSALAISTGIVAVGSDMMGPIVAKLVALPVTYAWGFVLSKFVVFRRAGHATPTTAGAGD